MVINDEAHHLYGEKRTRSGEDPEYIKWSKIPERISKAARLSLVIDLSATPWYSSGSPRPEGTLFEWLVSDFSVYDAFEWGLVKVVRLPDPDEHGRVYLDLWDLVKGAKTKEEYLRSCKGAIASIYSSWKKDHGEWASSFEFARTAGLCFAAVGTDTVGSIRYPAAVNGCVGLKPTYGRVSRYGVFALAASMDHVGLMTRTVEDAAIMSRSDGRFRQSTIPPHCRMRSPRSGPGSSEASAACGSASTVATPPRTWSPRSPGRWMASSPR